MKKTFFTPKSVFTFSCALSALVLGMVSPLGGQTLMLNFAPSGSPVDVNNATNSAGHTAGVISPADNVWNNLQNGDVSAGSLVWADGTTANGVSLDLGVSMDGSDVIEFANNPGKVGLGNQSTGIFSETSPARYGIWGGDGNKNNIAIGLRIDGLSAGTYDIYVVGRNTNNGGNLAADFFASAGQLSSTYDFSSDSLSVSVENLTSETSYIDGTNYGRLTITLGAGESLFLATEGTTGGEARGFLNAVQIVGVIPEASHFALILGGSVLALIVARRKRG